MGGRNERTLSRNLCVWGSCFHRVQRRGGGESTRGDVEFALWNFWRTRCQNLAFLQALWSPEVGDRVCVRGFVMCKAVSTGFPGI